MSDASSMKSRDVMWRTHETRGWVCLSCGYHASGNTSRLVHERRAMRGLGCRSDNTQPHTIAAPYTITPEQAASVTQVEQAFGTTRLLPPFDALPLTFQEGTAEAAVYHQLVRALFYGSPLSAGDVEMHPGVTPEMLRNCTLAHLRSFQPKHEHKIAGVAYMVSQLAKLVPRSAAA